MTKHTPAALLATVALLWSVPAAAQEPLDYDPHLIERLEDGDLDAAREHPYYKQNTYYILTTFKGVSDDEALAELREEFDSCSGRAMDWLTDGSPILGSMRIGSLMGSHPNHREAMAILAEESGGDHERSRLIFKGALKLLLVGMDCPPGSAEKYGGG